MGLAEVKAFLHDYGYWFYVVTFLWTFVEGETFVIYAGVLVAHNVLNGPLILACAWIGSFCGDQLYFYAGRRFGHRLIHRYPRWQPKIDAVEHWLARNDVFFILSFRWLYGIRNFASLGLGMSSVPWIRFVRLNFIAAGIWAVGFVGVGYIAGRLLRPLIDTLASYFTLVMLGIFGLMFGIAYLVHRIQSVLASRRQAPAGRPIE
jgi:membrane protein DedA with SNARE-associated domain